MIPREPSPATRSALVVHSPATVVREATPAAARDPLAVYLAGIRPASLRAVRTRLSMCVRAFGWSQGIDAFPWELLEPAHVRALSTTIGTRYAPSTAAAALVALRGVLHACWQCGHYALEEYQRRADAIVKPEGTRVLRGRALEPIECTAMFRLANGRDRAMLALLFGAGLRRSEAAAMRWSEISTDGALRFVGKGNRERTVPLPQWALRALEGWRAELLEQLGDLEPSSRVLRAWRGRWAPPHGSMSADGIYHALRSLGGRAGVHAVTPHDGRRTYISELLDVTDTVTASKLAGHASTAQTARYDRRGERALRDAVGGWRSIVEYEPPTIVLAGILNGSRPGRPGSV